MTDLRRAARLWAVNSVLLWFAALGHLLMAHYVWAAVHYLASCCAVWLSFKLNAWSREPEGK